VIGVGRRVSRKALNGIGEKHKGTPIDRHELARSLFLQHSERKEFEMKKTMLLALALACIFTIGLTCLPQRAMSEEIVIKAVTHMPKNYIALDPAREFLKRVNAKAKGRLKIDWLGGPEVIKTNDQVVALKAGTIDMLLFYPFGIAASAVPEAYCKGLSELAEWEERKTGAYELWCEIFEKRLNAKYLGRFQNLSGFYIYSKKKITKLDDFKGMKLRGTPLYLPFIEALGAAPVNVPLPDTYTALERGIVDGLMFTKFGMTGLGFQEVTKFLLNERVFQAEVATLVTSSTWAKIPKDLQQMIMEVMEDMEYIGTVRTMLIEEKEDEERRKAGMEFTQLSPEEAQKYRKLAYEKTWEYVLPRAPEYGPKLRALSSKSAVPKNSFPWQ
jgi:TRAP-type transport system periplasmic protein